MLRLTPIILLLLTNFAIAAKINQTGVAIADSKKLACKQALENAKQSALHQAGVNLFTTMQSESVTDSGNNTKTLTKKQLTSFGSIKTKSLTEKITFNANTAQITCAVTGVFTVDTSELKTQLLAVKGSYANEKKIQSDRAWALDKRTELANQYLSLKTNMAKPITLVYKGNFNCGDELAVTTCRQRLTAKIDNFAKQQLADTNNIDKKFITTVSTKLLQPIIIKHDNGLRAEYDGQITTKVTNLKNPYLTDIDSLNTTIGVAEVSPTSKPSSVTNSNPQSKNFLYNSNYFSNYISYVNVSGSGSQNRSYTNEGDFETKHDASGYILKLGFITGSNAINSNRLEISYGKIIATASTASSDSGLFVRNTSDLTETTLSILDFDFIITVGDSHKFIPYFLIGFGSHSNQSLDTSTIINRDGSRLTFNFGFGAIWRISQNFELEYRHKKVDFKYASSSKNDNHYSSRYSSPADITEQMSLQYIGVNYLF